MTRLILLLAFLVDGMALPFLAGCGKKASQQQQDRQQPQQQQPVYQPPPSTPTPSKPPPARG
jgi:hypothetical protein